MSTKMPWAIFFVCVFLLSYDKTSQHFFVEGTIKKAIHLNSKKVVGEKICHYNFVAIVTKLWDNYIQKSENVQKKQHWKEIDKRET